MEIFKELNGYEGCYEISNHGRIKCLVRKGVPKEIFKSLRIHPNHGYIDVQLRKDNKVKTLKLHRLVAINFLPNPNDLPVVNHKDGNKTNNHYSNLEWCTLSENSKHSFFNGLSKLPYTSGESNGFSKLKNEDVLKMRELYKNGSSIEDLNLKFNICKRHIRDIVSGKRWSHLN